MAVVKMKVTYQDGREADVIASPRAQVMTEERLAGMSDRRILGHFYLAWASLHRAGKESADFETFLDQVADAEVIEPDEDDEPDPTQPAQPGDISSV
jgi:hypothetical protein